MTRIEFTLHLPCGEIKLIVLLANQKSKTNRQLNNKRLGEKKNSPLSHISCSRKQTLMIDLRDQYHSRDQN